MNSIQVYLLPKYEDAVRKVAADAGLTMTYNKNRSAGGASCMVQFSGSRDSFENFQTLMYLKTSPLPDEISKTLYELEIVEPPQ